MLVTAHLPMEYFAYYDQSLDPVKWRSAAQALTLDYINRFKCIDVLVVRHYRSDVSFVEMILNRYKWFVQSDLFDAVIWIHELLAFYVALKAQLHTYRSNDIRALAAGTGSVLLAITTT